MTREEQIRNLNALNAVCETKDFYDSEFVIALKMAVDNANKLSKIDDLLEKAEGNTNPHSWHYFNLIADIQEILEQ